MQITPTTLSGCVLISPTVFEDSRGYFYESYNQRDFEKAVGYSVHFVQDNHSVSHKGVLRGLHYQAGAHAQAKLVRVIQGRVLDVVVDIRRDSPTYGQYFKMELSTKNYQMLFVPKGMAHGFLALEDNTIFTYKCDAYYNKPSERGILYNDTDLNIDWNFPEDRLILSEKDLELPAFKSLLG